MNELGILLATESFESGPLVEFASVIEALGFESLWLPELFGREPASTAGFLLARTSRLKVATGIANVYVRDAHCMAQTRRTLAELSGGRFMLGIGVSNVGLNTARGHHWQPPVAKLRGYLDTMAAAELQSPAPVAPAPLYLAAHGPRLQALGAERAQGILTYLMPPEHTRESRRRIGDAAELNVVCPMLAETDPAAARERIRRQLRYYLTLDYYHREWRKLGFDDADFANGGSDSLVDTIVGWGDAAALQARVAAYREAGATRIIALPLDVRRSLDESLPTLQALQA
jgi:probable F420-dependent oxidoreductase